ncbi:hypothetical protein KO516_03215 [Citreicella sp. C3M06]|uniref:hypothetical protein n=1 Tax=Citreicella sp. C3M06 TaxID=2841564 RepID=UPI001C0A558A|nr:hypothetical protein [Citreicella sp. C3M06]MBU2959851.1 hypothetical protein [Citreicella sp. C3M06]
MTTVAASRRAIYRGGVAAANCPPANNAYEFISAERAQLLPPVPATIKGLTPMDGDDRGDNHDPLVGRFNQWLLTG